MTTLPKSTADSTQNPRPPLSPLAEYWAKHPGQLDLAASDATGSIEQARAMKAEMDATARGAIDPDRPCLRMMWAYLAMGGALDLLDRQRAWHREWFGGAK